MIFPIFNIRSVFRTAIFPLVIWNIIGSGILNAYDGSLSGFVRDAENGETLIGANVFIQDTGIGTTTNKSGYFVITRVPAGIQTLVISYIGYEKKEIPLTIRSGQTEVVNVSLKPVVIEGLKVRVVGERRTEDDVKTSLINISPRKLQSVPQMAEPDLMRMIQTLPGVLTLSEFSSGLYIRGGTPDQNLILLDGTEVYNVNHLFGIFSTFDVDAVKQADLLKGGFPAQYGGRMSSVLDITNMDGNQKEFQGKSSISLISAKTSLQGPLGKGSWFFSGRRTYIDYAINTAEKITSGKTRETLEIIPDYYFYDLHFKLYQDLNFRNKVAFTFYNGQDHMNYQVQPFDMTMKWGNRTVTGKWTHLFSETFFMNMFATWSYYDVLMDEEDAFAKARFNNTVNDLTLKSDAEIFPSDRHTIKFGLVYKDLSSEFSEQLNEQLYVFNNTAAMVSCYGQDDWKLSPLFSFQWSVRFNLYIPKVFTNTFDRIRYEGKSRVDWEPRLSLEYKLTENTSLKSAFGRYLQYMTIVPFGNADFSFVDIWFPCDNSYPPGEAWHAIMGFKTRLLLNILMDLEVYYKKMPHVYEYNPNSNEIPEGQYLFYAGEGYSYGLDLYFEKNQGRMTGWLSYSLGWTKRCIPDLNQGNEYFPKYDRRHQVYLVTSYQISDRWQFNLTWTYGTGQAFTQPVAYYQLHLPDRPVPLVIGEDKNVSRLPPYHRMDIGVRYLSKPKEKFLKQWGMYFQVYNLYSRKNIWFRRVDAEEHPPETSDIPMLPVIPTFGFEFYY